MKSIIPKRAVLLVKKPGKFGLNGFYIVNSINRSKITMTGFDPIFSITGYHLMLRYNRVRYNGVDFVFENKDQMTYNGWFLILADELTIWPKLVNRIMASQQQ